MLNRPHLGSRVAVEPVLGRWRVAMEIPVAALLPPELIQGGSIWQFSFSRYDCGPNRPPIVSSTTPQRGAGFHRTEEWPQFQAPPFTTG